MRTRRLPLLVLTGLLVFTYASPALGGPDLAGALRRVDQREQRHYQSLDRRIKAAGLLALAPAVKTDVQYSSMTQSSNGTFFSGSARCTSGHLSGGGVDWGVSTEYGGYQVISSAPDIGGTAWHATVTIGGSPVPSTSPQVFAVCVSD